MIENFSDEELLEEGIIPHRTDDPEVWGLVDVARGRTPLVPTTIYKVAGDSVSGVVGLLFPDAHFLPIRGTNVGRTFLITPIADDNFFATTVWDGAAPCAEFIREGAVVREHSRGLLLGDYATKRVIARPRETRREIRVPGARTEGTAPQGELRCAA